MYNSIYPTYVKSYLGVNNRPITKKEDDEKSSRSSSQAENAQQQSNSHPKPSYDTNSYFPNGERVAIDYTKRKINITQVLTDFKNTANAIGAPDDIKSEVVSYLGLVEAQAQKESPNAQIIQSNLKNASQILDEYITNTLKKPSKVVENWVDALFLQQIDYKAPVAESIVVEEPAINVEESQIPPQVEIKSDIYVPQDARLKSMFIQAKKYAAIDNKEKALDSFQNVLEYAQELGDVQTEALAHFEQGRIYDEFDRIDDALFCYDRAAKQSSDNNVKAKAHLYMGQIYDDFVKFEPAVDHLCAAVSFAGEADNLKLQTKALTDLTQIHTERYDKENAFMFMDMSNIMAKETGNIKLEGVTLYKSADCCKNLNEKARALELYGRSADVFNSGKDYENLAKNYKSAAQIMIGFGNKAKAKKLLSKAFLALQKCDSPELKQEVINQITRL